MRRLLNKEGRNAQLEDSLKTSHKQLQMIHAWQSQTQELEGGESASFAPGSNTSQTLQCYHQMCR